LHRQRVANFTSALLEPLPPLVGDAHVDHAPVAWIMTLPPPAVTLGFGDVEIRVTLGPLVVGIMFHLLHFLPYR
jgi:hypothetical protein